jgi:3-oxoacyl-[acyl-carrier protein] reductase
LFGRIDILVNNAGMVTVDMDGWEDRRFLDMDDVFWDRDLALNLQTAYNATKGALPGMVERGWGRIVMVSSVTGPVATTVGSTGYAAAKAGMDGLMRGLAIEVARNGVTVNSVLPGWIATGSQTEPEHVAGLHTPVGRSGTPEEVGELIAFLASDRASYVTGQALVIDGGNVIQEAKGP